MLKFLCYLIGHGSKYTYRIQKADGKLYEITTCHRCWKETEKAVK
jgi:hypothetical protein